MSLVSQNSGETSKAKQQARKDMMKLKQSLTINSSVNLKKLQISKILLLYQELALDLNLQKMEHLKVLIFNEISRIVKFIYQAIEKFFFYVFYESILLIFLQYYINIMTRKISVIGFVYFLSLAVNTLEIVCPKKFEYISDRNYTQQQPTTLKYFLLAVNHNQLNHLKQQFESYCNKSPDQIITEPIKINIGILADNLKLQKLLTIKRYPFFGVILPSYLQRQSLMYGMPDIVTAQSVSNFISKIQRYDYYLCSLISRQHTKSSSSNKNNTICNKQQDHLDAHESNYPYKLQLGPTILRSLQKQHYKALEEIFFSKVFYLVDMYIDLDYLAQQEGEHTQLQRPDLIIYHQRNEQKQSTIKTIQNLESIQNLKNMLTRIALSCVNEFGEEIYNALKQLQGIINYGQQAPIFMAVLDSIHDRQKSHDYRHSLQQKLMLSATLIDPTLSFKQQITERYSIFWIEGSINTQKKQLLGFKQNDQPPLFAQLHLQQPQKHLLNINKPILHNNQFTPTKIYNLICQTVHHNKKQQLYNSFTKQLHSTFTKQQLQLISIHNYSQYKDNADNIKYLLADPCKLYKQDHLYQAVQFRGQCYIEKSIIFAQIQQIIKILQRVNRFTSVQYYLENINKQNQQKYKYDLAIVLNSPHFQSENKCSKIMLNGQHHIKMMESLIIEFGKLEKLPEYWWIPQAQIRSYLLEQAQLAQQQT